MTETASEKNRAAWILLLLLTAMNLVNYMDRYVVSAVLPLIKTDLALSDASLGTLATSFILSYLIFSPVAGYAGDRFTRKYLVSAAVFVWSLATIASGLARNHNELLIARAITGIGEAGYATMAPSMISDVFSRNRRGSVLSFFYAALPLGSAVGLTLGGYWGVHYGWRHAFYLAGGPGLLCALLMLFVPEPVRGGSDGQSDRRAHGSPLRIALDLVKIRTFLYSNLGMAAYTFAIGGLVFWVPTFLNRIRGMELQHATFMLGVLTVVAGSAGTIAGGAFCDRMRSRTKRSYVLIPGISLLLAFPPLMLFLHATTPAVIWSLLFVADFLLFVNTGPLNAAIINVVLPERRASAVAMNILIIHILGDALSPPLIGELSDKFGLLVASQVIATATIVAGVILVFGSRFVERDEAAVAAQMLE